MNRHLEVFELLVSVETRLWNQLDRELRATGHVALSHLTVLRFLNAHPGVRVQDVAREIDISPGGASKLLDRLVSARLVDRLADESDRRATRLVLTEAGQEEAIKASRLADSWLGTRLTGLSVAALGEVQGRLLRTAASAEVETGPVAS